MSSPDRTSFTTCRACSAASPSLSIACSDVSGLRVAEGEEAGVAFGRGRWVGVIGGHEQELEVSPDVIGLSDGSVDLPCVRLR
eukprot:759038-Hanusia_phi.AAC.4